MARHKRIRVLSYNIHQGLTIYRRQITLAMLKEAIRSLDVDIVLLQEVAGVKQTGRHKSQAAADEALSFQLEALADKVWPHQAYGKNALFPGGFHGNAILSRFPIVSYKNIDISLKNLIRRGMLHADVQVSPQETLQVIATHFGLLQYERQKQLQKLSAYVKKHLDEDRPFLLGGDFNDWRETLSKKFKKQLHLDEAFLKLHRRHARSFPSYLPMLRLDRVYYRGAIKPVSAVRLQGRPWHLLSDHLPLLVEFSL